MVICLEQSATHLHMVRLMPLPPRYLVLNYNPKLLVYLSDDSFPEKRKH